MDEPNLISEILNYLEEIGWTDLIDYKWKDSVIYDITDKYPNISNELLNKILYIILV